MRKISVTPLIGLALVGCGGNDVLAPSLSNSSPEVEANVSALTASSDPSEGRSAVHGQAAGRMVESAASAVALSASSRFSTNAGNNGPKGASCQPSHLSTTTGPMVGVGSTNMVTIDPVIWGSGPIGYTTTALDGFYSAAFVAGSYWYSWLRHEYHLASIYPEPTHRITLSSANASKTLVTDANIQSEITYQLENGGLPFDKNHGVGSMLYVIHMPSTVFVEWSGTSQLCGGANGNSWGPIGACAYNSSSTSFEWNGVPIHYAVMPDLTSGNCNAPSTPGGTICYMAGLTALQHQTSSESHELIEALTDPPGGWVDTSPANCNQIGDICNRQSIVISGSGSTAQVAQAMWSNVANQCEGNSPGAASDFTQAGASGIVLAGNTGTNYIPIANPTAPGKRSYTMTTRNWSVDNNEWFSDQGDYALPVAGDFNGDGYADVAVVGGSTSYIPVAFSQAGGSAHVVHGVVTTAKAPSGLGQGAAFPTFATQSPLPPVSGDFNGDGIADIALVGGWGNGPWNTIPVAFGTNDGSGDFWATNNTDNGFNNYITTSYTRPNLVAADFNGDGLTDLALVGLTNSSYVGQARNGNFTVKQISLTAPAGGSTSDFNTWAGSVNAVAGDFDGDGFGDIALAGGIGWTTIPLAFMRQSSNQFSVLNAGGGPNATFAANAVGTGTELLSGDFDGDGITDLALTGPNTWNFVGFAFSPTLGSASGGFQWESNASGMATFAKTAGSPGAWAASVAHGGPYVVQTD
jgi:hypothetical protein